MLNRFKTSKGESVALSAEQHSFDDLFGRFRVVVFNKLSRSLDLKRNNEILKSVFMKLYELVNKKSFGDAPSLSLIEFKISVHNLFPGFSLDEVRRLFLYFDEDGNGKISVEEFVVGIKVSPLTTADCLVTVDTVFEYNDDIFILFDLYRASSIHIVSN